MAYRTIIEPLAARSIRSWDLPDFVFVEVRLRLIEQLARRYRQLLRPSRHRKGGMLYRFGLVDPQNRMLRHDFVFRVYFGADEETLRVTSGRCRRTYFG